MSLLRQASPKISRISFKFKRLGKRHAHTSRDLPYPIEGGLGKFLPPKALETLTEYQDGLLSRLEQELRTDTKAEMHSSVAQIALKYAEQKDRTLAFNYAVLAWNNSFFLDNLAPPPPEEETELIGHQADLHDTDLLAKIRQHYTDLPRLKSTFSAAALGMFTNGWVWMVTDTTGNLGILPTFGPSTLLIRSRTNMATNNLIFREPNPDDPTPIHVSTGPTTPPGLGATSPVSGLSNRPSGASGLPLEPHARAYSSFRVADLLQPRGFLDEDDHNEDALGRKEVKFTSVGETIYPLFCLSTYEHTWMSAGFGVLGKEDWVKEFWTVLDWKKVARTYDDVMKRVSLK